MERSVVALFGEAERGEFRIPHHLNDLDQLVDRLGQPPADSQGLSYAVQSLLFNRHILFFRVENEGFSSNDYLAGLEFLRRDYRGPLTGLCLPGVGDHTIIEAAAPLCEVRNTLLLLSEADLYDFLHC